MSWADIVQIVASGVIILAIFCVVTWKIFGLAYQIYANSDKITKIDAKLDRLASDVAKILAVIGKTTPRDRGVELPDPEQKG